VKASIAACIVAWAIVGCAAIGPTDQAEFNRGIVAATPAKEGKVQFSGAGTWWANAKGFNNFRSALISTGVSDTPGAVVFTDRSVLFQQWESKTSSFAIIKKIPFQDIREVTLDEFGVNRSIVVRSLEYQYDSFTFTVGQGSFVDIQKTVAGYDYLNRAVQAK
jgi:hypothetical protein